MGSFGGLIVWIVNFLSSLGISLDKEQIRSLLTTLVDKVLEPLATQSPTPWDDVAVKMLKRIIANGPLFDKFLDWIFDQVQGAPAEGIGAFAVDSMSSDLKEDLQKIAWEVVSE